MKKAVFLFPMVLFMILSSCNNDTDTEPIPDPAADLPDCIQSITDITPQIKIQSQEVNGSTNYWLNTGANEADGDEYIISESCDTVCYYGGWVNPDCIDAYDSESWTVVWP